MAPSHENTTAQRAPAQSAAEVGSSAALISIFVIISRITGFLRTWAMAFALGSTVLASSYQVANNLPNMLYELVLGGMLVTAFLPVYISVKEKLGQQHAHDYANNLLSITFVLLGSVAVLATLFAPQLIYTQSFMNDQESMKHAIFFFRFFAIQIVFYGIGSLISGLLNASRDYLWSSAAPIFNNIIVMTTFILYALVSAHGHEQTAHFILAIGNPLGVFVQMAIQVPALRKQGLKYRFHINLKDPALLETLSIGIPAIIVMALGLVIVSVQNAAAYNAADNGPSVVAYARLWFTLPYAFLTVPITTTMFTEISHHYTNNDISGFMAGIISGVKQILFFMIPFALFLMVFSKDLVTLYKIGAFTSDVIGQVALYLSTLAISLPFYGVNSYLQKAFSATRRMHIYATFMAIGAIIQIIWTLVFATDILFEHAPLGLPAVALGESIFYALVDAFCFMYLHTHFKSAGKRSIISSALRSTLFGLLGAGTGYAIISIFNFLIPENISVG
ncbi:MAG: murein biosynthesis integral membrane protein MurJ, partial [Eggerthellaceae bacterium]|nr:murein biosynthesis integral membrane protein MurJ [Eggerthellaceae bacterium]